MKRSRRIIIASLFAFSWLFSRAVAQDLAPRAYVIAPVGSNALTVGFTHNSGDVSVDPSVPLEDFRASFQTQTLSYFYSFDTLGRSSNITVLFPYAVGNFSATLGGNQAAIYRSGVADTRVRFAMNLFGGPAMQAKDFSRWKEKGLLGVSFTVLVPTGQYDPAKVINVGSNRWGFKPEVGLSRRWR